MKIKRYFLIFAFCAAALIALLYGVDPQWFVAVFLGLDGVSTGVAHILRAIMGLYIALGAFWLYAAFDRRFTDAAILTTICFCGGLVSGRVVSFFLDGRPPGLLVFYAAVEFILVPVAIWVYRLPAKCGAV